MKAIVMGTFAALLALQIGCEKTDAPAPTAAASAPTESANTVVPSQEDYEVKAEAAIAPSATPVVLGQELDKLEKEIGQ